MIDLAPPPLLSGLDRPALIRPAEQRLILPGEREAKEAFNFFFAPPFRVPRDIYFASVSLLIQAKSTDADASTSIPDRSPVGHTVTVNGDAQIDTAQTWFGRPGILFDGTGDYLSIADHASLELPANFTLEIVGRPNAVSGYAAWLAKSASYGPYLFGQNDTNPLFGASSNGSSYDITNGAISGAADLGTIAATTTTYLAVRRSGNTYTAYQDGVQTNTWTSSATPIDNANALQVGAQGGANLFTGHIFAVRITKGVARTIAPLKGPFPTN